MRQFRSKPRHFRSKQKISTQKIPSAPRKQARACQSQRSGRRPSHRPPPGKYPTPQQHRSTHTRRLPLRRVFIRQRKPHRSHPKLDIRPDAALPAPDDIPGIRQNKRHAPPTKNTRPSLPPAQACARFERHTTDQSMQGKTTTFRSNKAEGLAKIDKQARHKKGRRQHDAFGLGLCVG